MKKAFGVIKIILIAALAVFLIHLLLRWKPLDDFLTSKIGGPSVKDAVSGTLIRIGNVHGLLPESQKPYVYEESGRLYTIYKGRSVDITPEGVSPVFYGNESGLGEKLRYRDHACFDEASGKLLFVVDVQNVPELFLAELESAEDQTENTEDQAESGEDVGELVGGSAVDEEKADPEASASGSKLVADNVNSFFFLGGEPVYAEGYDKFNSLNIYLGGGTVKIIENASYVPVPELGGVLYLTTDGILGFFSMSGMKTYVLTEKATEIKEYSAFGDGKLLVYSAADNTFQSILFDLSSGRAVRAVVDHVPEKCLSGGAEALVFDQSDGKISLIDGDGETTALFAGSGRIYNMFEAKCPEGSETGYEVIFANKKGIYKGSYGSGGENVALLCAFNGTLSRYSSDPWLITYHLEAGGDYENGFYLMALSDLSHIYNGKNPLSWLNRFSTYIYRLMYVSGGKVYECGVPLSRAAELPETISGTTVLYTAYFAEGDIKSLSVLDKTEVICRDALRSEGMARGSSVIRKELAGGKVYIAAVRNPGRVDEYVDSCILEDDLSAVKTEDGTYAVSFGEAVKIS